MAKTGALLCTSSRGDLNLQTRVSFSITPTAAFAPIVPPNFALSSVTSISTGAGQTTSCTELQFNVASQIPCWCKPGVGVKIAFTIGGVAFTVTGVVNAIDTSAGLFFTIALSFHENQFTNTTWSAATVSAATATLIIQAQWVEFLAPSGNAGATTLADCVDNVGGAAWTKSIAAGATYDFPPTGPLELAKFDLKDYIVKNTNGTDTLIVSFI